MPRHHFTTPALAGRLTLALCLLAPLAAQAQENGFSLRDVKMAVGVKLWANNWTSWTGDNYDEGSGLTTDFVSISGRKTAWIPSISIRYRDFALGASSFKASQYKLNGSELSAKASRRESEVSLGYYLLPTVAASLSYKAINQTFSTYYRFTGPTLGISGSAPLTGSNFSVYGAFGLGFLNAKFGDPDASGRTKFDADYTLSEFGFAYAFGKIEVLSSTLTGTLGFRQQSISTKDYKGHSLNGGYFTDKVRDNTQGLTMGLVASF